MYFSDLRSYNVADLSPGVFYDPDDVNQKPITLTIMGLGVPKFPDVEHDEDVIRSINCCKGSLYNKVDIVPNNNKAKPHLLKEVIRRHIIKGGPSGDESKISNWKIKQTILWLKNNPPAEIEFDLILEF